MLLAKRHPMFPEGELLSPLSGVYRLAVVGTDESYVGSAKNISARISTHAIRMRTGRTTKAFKRIIDLHGHEAFRAEVLEECPVEKLAEAEDRWIRLLKPSLNVRPVTARAS